MVAFYAFFAPFLGGRLWEYVLVGTYSPVVRKFSYNTIYDLFVSVSVYLIAIIVYFSYDNMVIVQVLGASNLNCIFFQLFFSLD